MLPFSPKDLHCAVCIAARRSLQLMDAAYMLKKKLYSYAYFLVCDNRVEFAHRSLQLVDAAYLLLHLCVHEYVNTSGTGSCINL